MRQGWGKDEAGMGQARMRQGWDKDEAGMG